MKKKVVVISGFSGCGKGTVIKKLLENNPNMSLVRSMTTRKPRVTETDEYIFVDDKDFLEAQRNGVLLEFNQYDNHMYGTPSFAVQEILQEGKIPVLEIDSNGFEALRKHPALSSCEIIGIFLEVSADELLMRLEGRRTESYESIINRLMTAKEETEKIENYDCILENNNTEVTVKRIEDYIHNVNRSSDKFDEQIFVDAVDKLICRLNNTDSVENLKHRVKRFTDIRDWTKYHSVKDISIGIATEAAELLQIFRFKSDEQIKEMLNNPKTAEHVREEIGDVFFFLLDLSEHTGMNLGECLLEKLVKNAEKYPVDKVKGINRKYDEI